LRPLRGTKKKCLLLVLIQKEEEKGGEKKPGPIPSHLDQKGGGSVEAAGEESGKKEDVCALHVWGFQKGKGGEKRGWIRRITHKKGGKLRAKGKGIIPPTWEERGKEKLAPIVPQKEKKKESMFDPAGKEKKGGKKKRNRRYFSTTR